MVYTQAPFPGLPHKALYVAPVSGGIIRPHNKQNTVYVLAGPENPEIFSTNLLMYYNYITRIVVCPNCISPKCMVINYKLPSLHDNCQFACCPCLDTTAGIFNAASPAFKAKNMMTLTYHHSILSLSQPNMGGNGGRAVAR
jgi:hypothetical protein